MEPVFLFYLIASILSSTLIVLEFKWFEVAGIKTFQAITINYLVCVIVGSLLMGNSPFIGRFWENEWFPFSIVLGFMFISGFYAVAKTIQLFGVTVGSVMQKMSLILTVTFAIGFYGEATPLLKILGIILALVAVVLTNLKKRKAGNKGFKVSPLIFIPLFVFFVSGGIEIIIQYVKLNVLGSESELGFTIFLFGTAGAIGSLFLIGGSLVGKTKLHGKSIAAGVALGIPNFFSIYCLLLVLGSGVDASIIFTINNVTIIGLSAILAFFIFNEKLNRLNVVGVFLAAMSIILIAIAK